MYSKTVLLLIVSCLLSSIFVVIECERQVVNETEENDEGMNDELTTIDEMNDGIDDDSDPDEMDRLIAKLEKNMKKNPNKKTRDTTTKNEKRSKRQQQPDFVPNCRRWSLC